MTSDFAAIQDEFDRGVQAIHASPGSHPEFTYSQTPPEYRPGLAGRTAASPSLPVGAAVPTYQPSAVAKGAAALPARADGRLVQSTQETQRAVLADLGLTQRAVEVRPLQISASASCHARPLDTTASAS